MEVELIQFLRPNGRQRTMTQFLSDDCTDGHRSILKSGARLTAEVLTNGVVSMTIEEPVSRDDFDIVLVPNGPQVPVKLAEMIKRFDAKKYQEWKKRG